MEGREKVCLQKNAQSSGTSNQKGTASLITSAPMKKKEMGRTEVPKVVVGMER